MTEDAPVGPWETSSPDDPRLHTPGANMRVLR